MVPSLVALTQATVNSMLIVAFGVTLTFFATWYWTTQAKKVKEASDKAAKLAEENTALLERIAAGEARTSELEKTHAVLQQAVTPLAATFQAMLIKSLTHFHTPVLDALLAKLEPENILTTHEEAHLEELLRQRCNELSRKIDEHERGAAFILPTVIKMVKAEAQALKLAVPEIKVVQVMPDHDPEPEIEPEKET